jgi:lipopolysaccharide/colanic/teichoic acid biosynthesis glycosyltransferase
MEWDLKYVEEKSLLLDLKILAGTIPAVLRQCWDVRKRK